METRAKANAKFEVELKESLLQHDNRIDQTNISLGQINATLQTIIVDSQTLHVQSLKNLKE